MYSSATASYSESGVCRAKAVAMGREIAMVKKVRRRSFICGRQLVRAAQTVTDALRVAKKFRMSDCPDRSDGSINMRRHFFLTAFVCLLLFTVLFSLRFHSLGAANDEEDNG